MLFWDILILITRSCEFRVHRAGSQLKITNAWCIADVPKMAAGSGQGEGGGNPLWMFLWFLFLIFFGFPIAGFCAGFYILIMPFTVCIDGLTVSFVIHSLITILIYSRLCETLYVLT